MIKTVTKITLIALIATLFSACSDKEPEPKNVEKNGCYIEDTKAPNWACVPEVDGFYAGVGIAQNSAAGIAHMRKVALANGRSDLAQQIQTQVKDKVENFTRATGNGDRETVDHVATAVTKQVAKVNLAASKAVDSWQAPSGALYLLVTVPAGEVNKEVKKAVKTSFKNDEALWQQFQSKQALESLEAEFPEN